MATTTATAPVPAPAPDPTRAKIAEMLTENTGRHFLDSGGAYGRHWEHNQGREFAAEPAGSLRFEHGYINTTLSVFHWLADKLDYNPALDALYRDWANRDDQVELDNPEGYYDLDDCDEDALRAIRAEHKGCEDYGHHLHSAEQFANDVCKGRGIYGDGDPISQNTYNGECMLSQVLQFVYWEDDDGAHVLLQIHGGCDVRGGYTDPVAFDVCEELSIFDNAKGYIGCSGHGCDVNWYTDDGCHWYPEGTCGRNHSQLEDFEFVTDRPENYDRDDPLQLFLLDIGHTGQSIGTGKVYVDDDGRMHCPVCGAKLELYG